MEIQPEIIYGSIAALVAAVVSMWRKFSISEAECRKQLNTLWQNIFELKRQSLQDELGGAEFVKWPDRRETVRRNGQNNMYYSLRGGREQRSGSERRVRDG